MGTATQDLLLHVEDLHKRFDDHVVLAGVELGVLRGSVFSVLGPSGAGKSVFLKCLADVMQPDAGRISFDGRPMSFTDPSARKEFRRRCSFLFQGNGMQKRLALARAIVTRPELVFFDEPTAGLDPLRRNAVFTMIAQYQRQFGFTALVVTHDVVEALIASDRVALLDHGRICFEGTPAEFSASAHPVVCGFRDSTDTLGHSLAAIRRGEHIQPDNS